MPFKACSRVQVYLMNLIHQLTPRFLGGMTARQNSLGSVWVANTQDSPGSTIARAMVEPGAATGNNEKMAELVSALDGFVSSFELVFDQDWDMTRSCLQNPEHLIDQRGTFIQPLVSDEGNNWANRGTLLAEYRELLECMEKYGVERRTCP